MTDQATLMRDQVAAVHQLLIGKRSMKPSAAITGGGPLTMVHKTNIALMAVAAQTDLLHVEFAENDAGGFGIVGICLFIPRGTRCHVLSDVRLWLGDGATYARLVPDDDARGHFCLSPGELLHVDGKPDRLDEGIARAHARLMDLVPTASRSTRVYSYAGLHASA